MVSKQLDSKFHSKQQQAIFPQQGFEKVLGWWEAWLTEVIEVYFERNFTKPTTVIRILLGHIASGFCRKTRLRVSWKTHFD